MNEYIILDRLGYGSNFNNIYIDYNNKFVKKECNNSDGLFKLNNEINIYKFIICMITFMLWIIYMIMYHCIK